MLEPNYLALFVVGLLGGTHCVGMCGGIVGALSMGSSDRVALHLAYNAGRIASYVLAGALAGALGEAGVALSGSWSLRLGLYLLANATLVALGLYLMGVSGVLAVGERAGQTLWRRLQPLTRRFLPARTVAQALPLGALWGWLPCGLVYGALVSALSAGSSLRGAGAMLAFGLGTLPNLLLAGLMAGYVRRFVRRKGIRVAVGTVILLFGLWGMYAVVRMAVAS